MESIQLQGKIFLTGDIKAVTGLHIGGDSGNLDIGGIDNPVIRNPFDRQPYIPGSSLRGKMRSLLDRHLNNLLNKSVGQDVMVHECEKYKDYKQCPVCQVFGVAPAGDLRGKTMPTRLIVRDVSLTEGAIQKLTEAETEGDFTEAKWEVAIDRITSAATPRQIERVPAGATFGPFELVYGIYTRDTGYSIAQELDFFDVVLTGMALLEDDYLGGSGTRGYGKIAFESLEMTFKPRAYYETSGKKPKSIKVNTNIEALRDIDYKQEILNAVSAK